VATPQSNESQTHQRRVRKIAGEAAEKIAAASPVEEEVVVTVEELPPNGADKETDGGGKLGGAVKGVVAPLTGRNSMERLAAVTEANVEFVKAVIGAEVKFASRMVGALTPSRR
jgi:hypothetical protein